MKIDVVRYLVENYTIDQLTEAELSLINGQDLPFEVEGDDASEKLSYLLASIFVLEKMRSMNVEFVGAYRQFTLQVRESI